MKGDRYVGGCARCMTLWELTPAASLMYVSPSLRKVLYEDIVLKGFVREYVSERTVTS